MADGRARALRQRLTIPEPRLWDELRLLRRRGYHFRRQASLVVDFACLSQRLVIEVDGVQHMEPARAGSDAKRDERLRLDGYEILRFSNSDVMENIDGVMLDVLVALGAVVGHD